MDSDHCLRPDPHCSGIPSKWKRTTDVPYASVVCLSVFGSGIVAIIGIIILTKNFADFDYDEEAAEE